MTQQHTPGPWEVCNSLPLVVDENGQYIATCDGASTCWPNKAAVDANARLIAAAPELLVALKALLGDCENPHAPATARNYCKPMAILARAAIAKATGTP